MAAQGSGPADQKGYCCTGLVEHSPVGKGLVECSSVGKGYGSG